jgi:hypothetical protein
MLAQKLGNMLELCARNVEDLLQLGIEVDGFAIVHVLEAVALIWVRVSSLQCDSMHACQCCNVLFGHLTYANILPQSQQDLGACFGVDGKYCPKRFGHLVSRRRMRQVQSDLDFDRLVTIALDLDTIQIGRSARAMPLMHVPDTIAQHRRGGDLDQEQVLKWHLPRHCSPTGHRPSRR